MSLLLNSLPAPARRLRSCRISIMFGLFLLIGKCATIESRACSCIEQSVIEAVKSADVVFVGKVVSRIETDNYRSVGLSEIRDTSYSAFPALPETAIAKIVVEKMYRGKVDSETIVITSSVSSESCGYYFQVDKTYTVYARQTSRFKLISPVEDGDVRVFATSICSRTRQWNQEEEDAILAILKK